MGERETKIKICGLRRLEDVALINEAKPDYCGFVIDFPKSHRFVPHQEVGNLTKEVDPSIPTVGVFVNSPILLVAELLESDVIRMAQLHGDEDEAYIAELRKRTQKPILKAFAIRTSLDVEKAAASSADYVLLDNGMGTGEAFDWSWVKEFQERTDRPFFLAGGLNAKNLQGAISACHPYAVDLSSGVETNGTKDAEKVKKVMDVISKL